MKEETRRAFSDLLVTHPARVRPAATERERKAAEREQFKTDWKRIAQTIVGPAVEQVVNEILRPNGWQCRVLQNQDDVVLECHKGKMRGIAGSYSPPQLTFKMHDYANKVWVQLSTRSHGEAAGEYLLSQIDEDLVQSLVLKFVRRLVGESGNPGDVF
jgi:hypothetical protein